MTPLPDRWLVLAVRSRETGALGPYSLVVDTLVELGARAVEERDGAWITHLPPPDDPETFVEEVRQRLSRLPGVEGVDVTWSWQPHEEWAETWKRGLGPRRVTERLVVAPWWTEPEVGPGDRVIRLDPGVAFGTAEHGSTRGCLRLLEPVVEDGDRVLDLGAGTGILAIAAAQLGAGPVVAVESDPYACDAARENVERNGVAEAVRVVEAQTDAVDVADRGPVDGIAANIRTDVLLGLLPGVARALTPGGWLVVGGVPEGERERLIRAARSEGFVTDGEHREEGWWSGRFVREGSSPAE